MVSIPMKKNPFTEKITSLKIYNVELGKEFETLNNINLYPTSIPLVVEVDFFNIRPNTDYILTTTAHFPNDTSYPVHATRVNIPMENLSFINQDGLGKANGSFQFNLTLTNPSDMFLYFILLDENGEPVDSVYSYHGFGRW